MKDVQQQFNNMNLDDKQTLDYWKEVSERFLKIKFDNYELFKKSIEDAKVHLFNIADNAFKSKNEKKAHDCLNTFYDLFLNLFSSIQDNPSINSSKDISLIYKISLESILEKTNQYKLEGSLIRSVKNSLFITNQALKQAAKESNSNHSFTSQEIARRQENTLSPTLSVRS